MPVALRTEMLMVPVPVPVLVPVPVPVLVPVPVPVLVPVLDSWQKLCAGHAPMESLRERGGTSERHLACCECDGRLRATALQSAHKSVMRTAV